MNKKERILKNIFDYHAGTPLNKVTPFEKFVRKSNNHFYIVLLLASCSNDHPGYHYEEIIEMYPHLYASRTTIHTVLNEGVENNFFTKHKNIQDHRKQNYKLSFEQKKEAISWLDNHPIRDYNR